MTTESYLKRRMRCLVDSYGVDIFFKDKATIEQEVIADIEKCDQLLYFQDKGEVHESNVYPQRREGFILLTGYVCRFADYLMVTAEGHKALFNGKLNEIDKKVISMICEKGGE